MLGLDYEVQYKKGAENKVVDALSRKQEGMDPLDDQNLVVISRIGKRAVESNMSRSKN